MIGAPLRVGFGRAARIDVPRGNRLVVTVADGRQVADITVLGLHQGMTRNAAGWRRFGRPSLAVALEAGDGLLDGNARVLGVVDEAPSGQLDAVYPGCWSEIHPDGRLGCRDLLAQALGVPRAVLPGVLSAFGAPARLADGGIHGWEGVAAEPGARIVIRAHDDLVAAVSACPDDAIPGAVPGILELSVEGT